SAAARVARSASIPAITFSGIDDDSLYIFNGEFIFFERVLTKGEVVPLDGYSGNLYRGDIPKVPATTDGDYKTVIEWAQRNKRLKVYATANNLDDVQTAARLNAEGLGQCK